MGRKKTSDIISYENVIEMFKDRNEHNFLWKELYCKYGYHKNTIQKIFQYYNLPYKEKIYGSIERTQQKLGLNKINEIKSLRSQGYTYEYISDKLDIAICCVAKVCEQLNIKKGNCMNNVQIYSK